MDSVKAFAEFVGAMRNLPRGCDEDTFMDLVETHGLTPSEFSAALIAVYGSDFASTVAASIKQQAADRGTWN